MIQSGDNDRLKADDVGCDAIAKQQQFAPPSGVEIDRAKFDNNAHREMHAPFEEALDAMLRRDA
jgi:hypothetical protein